MNTSSKVAASPSSATEEEIALPSFSQLWQGIEGSGLAMGEVTSELHEISEIFQVASGETILHVPILSQSENPATAVESGDGYIVFQGKVRLLGFDLVRQREVSIQLLGEGEILGGDCLRNEEVLPYRAVASSPVQIAKIPASKLQAWLERFPELKREWLAAVRRRQTLIFFKTQSDLRSLSTQRIQKLLAYMRERKIPADAPIAWESPSDASSRFWLRSGQIRGSALSAGDSWGYPAELPQDWVAATDLLVYQLPQKYWEAAVAIAPMLAQLGTPSASATPTAPLQRVAPESSLPSAFAGAPSAAIATPAATPSSQPPHKLEAKVVQPVDFPEPTVKRRRAPWRGYPWIAQQSSSDCGAACLAMVSQYWGKRLGLNTLRNLIGVGRSGAALKNLAKAADTLGYQARPVRASFNSLAGQTNPWIAHWRGTHYIVVYRVRNNKVLVADPALGKRLLSQAEFLEHWTGYALLLDPTERLYQAPGEKRSLSQFLRLIWLYRSLGLQIVLVSILIQIFGLVSPLFTQVILDSVVVSKSQSTLNIFVIGVVLFGLGGLGLGSTRTYWMSYLSNRLDLTMVSGFINHVLRLPLKYFESRRVGDVITRVQENQKIQRFLIGQVLLAWLNLVTGFVYLGLMLYYNWKLTVLVLMLIPPIAIFTLLSTPLLRKISRERFNAAAEQNSALVEMISGISSLKSVAVEQEFRWRWEELLTHQLNVRFKGQKLGIALGIISKLISTVGSAALLWYGATLVINNQLSIGQYVAFNMMKGHILGPALALVGLWDELQEVLISVERLNDVFEADTEDASDGSLLVLPELEGNIKFENVTFSYDAEGESAALQNISFEVKAGQTIAIVGRSGSGKSTLVKLLQGLYYPTSGTLWVDGHDIRHLAPHSLREKLGVVPQECFLFSGTILENITLHRSEFSLEQVIEVAKLAEAHSFIQAMPLGYRTKVGEWGVNLSGGQRQRIAIARALLGAPKVLILDEATSSLDTESERRFQNNLARLSRERTVFIIAHRLSTVRNADRILVLSRGLLAEQGTHTELMHQKGLYYHLAQQQIDL